VIETVCQRWRERRTSYRPAGEVIDPRRYEVAKVADDTTPRAFVTRHHYSGRWLAARERVLLYRGAQLVGAAVFSQPGNDNVLNALPFDHDVSLELGRLVLLDDVPGNAESWFIARCFELLRRDGYEGVVSFSDPVPRRLDGRLIMPGHRGIIYQASRAFYAGRSTPQTTWLLPTGEVFSNDTWGKLRLQKQGWQYGMRQLVAAGAAPWDGIEPTRVWALRELHRVGRKVRHRGKHRYVFGLGSKAWRAVARMYTPAIPYPRAIDPEPEVRRAA
jgi:hypothetical protein